VCFEVVCEGDFSMLLFVFIMFSFYLWMKDWNFDCVFDLVGERMIIMNGIYARYNEQKNCIDVTVFEAGYVLRLDCGKWEDGIKITLNSQGRLDVMVIDDPLEYTRLAMDEEMQVWVDALDDDSVW